MRGAACRGGFNRIVSMHFFLLPRSSGEEEVAQKMLRDAHHNQPDGVFRGMLISLRTMRIVRAGAVRRMARASRISTTRKPAEIRRLCSRWSVIF
ncbi:hypothetical protein CHELA20_51497 [Hyphomicrobiales bacterium]|nr:hypothetical protein CHELA41_23519 [Hyphomicrobiales bacterium]CAH1676470.1 hypothetical protein CHELA20_51497 [Hyphomicrobiales bacterium]